LGGREAGRRRIEINRVALDFSIVYGVGGLSFSYNKQNFLLQSSSYREAGPQGAHSLMVHPLMVGFHDE
jgi:hypothetical protein